MAVTSLIENPSSSASVSPVISSVISGEGVGVDGAVGVGVGV